MSAPTDDSATSGLFPRLRLLWSFARPHRARLALGLVLGLLASAMGLATPMVTKWVLDSLNTGGSLANPVLALLGLLVFGGIVTVWQMILLGTVGERIVLDVRESMVRRFFRATVSALTKRSSGELVTRVTSDTLLLREAAASSVIGLLNGAIMLVGTLVLMGVLDLALLGTTLVAVTVVAVLFATLMPGIAKSQERAQEYVGRLGGVLEGALRAIRTVKVSRAEERQAEQILGDARESAQHSIRAVRREAIALVTSWSGVQLAIIVIIGFGAWRVGLGALEVSSLVAFLLYAFGLMDPIGELSQNLTALQSGIAAADRIRAIEAMEEEPAPRTAPGARSIGGSVLDRKRQPDREHQAEDGPVLELRGVTAAYGPDSEPALRQVDLAIPRRGHLAIVGPSGAGKTTLFSLLLRFLEPQEGELRLGDVRYADLDHQAVRARLAYVEQDTPVVPGTVRDNLLYTHHDATEEELERILRDVHLTELVDSLEDGLDTPLAATAVSGGQRQRIALARALLRSPDVLLLDEATAQLDGITEAAIHESIAERARTGAVVTIAHRLSTVIDADTIVVLDGGRIRARGTHEELLAYDELYRDLVRALRIDDAAGTPVG